MGDACSAMGGPGKGKGGGGVDGTLPRRNIESFSGNAQFGDRNRGMIDWALVFEEERRREKELAAKRPPPSKRPQLAEISDYDMAAMAVAWAEKAGEKPKKKRKRKVDEEEDSNKETA